jgi:hypothetical protein
MEMNLNMEETLWNYIDGSMNDQQLLFVEELLQSNQEWRAKYAELMEVHQLMQDSVDLEQPSLRFTQNVMEEISRLYITPATGNYINKNIIWGIGLFFLTTIAGLVIYGIGNIDWSKPDSSGAYPSLDVPAFNWSQFFTSSYMNGFIMINIVLGLMLLDMYLTKRKLKIKT